MPNAEHPALHFVAPEPPVMNESIAVVLARIVRTLRERQKTEAA